MVPDVILRVKMSYFCKQCSIEMFGKDFKELADDVDHYDLCEGCGHVWVSKDGECIDPECTIHGNNPTREMCDPL